MSVLNFKLIVWLLIAGALSALVFNTVMVSYDHNEQMYITAGVLVSQGQQLYKDFAYLQTPNLPLLYALIFRLTEANAYLFVAKSITFLFYLGSAFMLYLITRHLTKNQFWAAGLTTLFMLNSSNLRAAEESSNYMLPILLTFVAFYLYLRAQDSPSGSTLNLLLCGVCLTLAMGTKLYYVLLIPPFVLILAYSPRGTPFTQRVYRQLTPFVVGLLIGAFPIIWYGVKDAQTFWFYNVGYHLRNTEWRQMMGYEEAMTLPSKLTYAAELFEETNNALLVAMCALMLLAYRRLSALMNHPHAAQAFLSIGLLITSLPAVMIPTPIFSQYYAMPISLLFLLLAVLYPVNQLHVADLPVPIERPVFNRFLLVVIILSAIMTIPSFQEDLDSPWVTNEVASQAEEIRTNLDANLDQPGKVATFAPLFALEAGRAIYPELATGPFLYRVGTLLSLIHISEPTRHTRISDAVLCV